MNSGSGMARQVGFKLGDFVPTHTFTSHPKQASREPKANKNTLKGTLCGKPSESMESTET